MGESEYHTVKRNLYGYKIKSCSFERNLHIFLRHSTVLLIRIYNVLWVGGVFCYNGKHFSLEEGLHMIIEPSVFSPFNRSQNCYQVSLWTLESADNYGAVPTGLKLPDWASLAMGYSCGLEAFTAYSEGDWYDGIGSDYIDMEIFNILMKLTGNLAKGYGFLFWMRNNYWHVYQGPGKQLSCWIELRLGSDHVMDHMHEWETLSDQDEKRAFDFVKNQENDKEVLKKRLLIYLYNVEPKHSFFRA